MTLGVNVSSSKVKAICESQFKLLRISLNWELTEFVNDISTGQQYKKQINKQTNKSKTSWRLSRENQNSQN
jgi:hypothetical protein